MQIQDLSKTKLTETEEGYELSFTDPEWGDQVHVAHLHFDSEPEEAKKGAALLRASFEMQKALESIYQSGYPLRKDSREMMKAALELSRKTNNE